MKNEMDRHYGRMQQRLAAAFWQMFADADITPSEFAAKNGIPLRRVMRILRADFPKNFSTGELSGWAFDLGYRVRITLEPADKGRRP